METRNSSSACFSRSRLLLTVVSCCHLLLWIGSLKQSRAAETPEYQLKAVLLWRLAQYTEWPLDTFKDTNSPIVIGVIGENPFGDALELAIRGETAHHRPLRVQYLRSNDRPEDCHMLFVCKSERFRLRSLFSRLPDKGILTVSDIDDFSRTEKGMIRFAMEQNRVNLIVNLDAVTGAGLRLDARLLRMAEVEKSR